jgi:hypothetical protein
MEDQTMLKLLLLAALALLAGATTAAAQSSGEPARILVEFAPGTDEATIEALHASLGARLVRSTVANLDTGSRLDIVEVPYAAAAGRIAEAYRSNPAVLIAQREERYAVPQPPADDGGGAAQGRNGTGEGLSPLGDMPGPDE